MEEGHEALRHSTQVAFTHVVERQLSDPVSKNYESLPTNGEVGFSKEFPLDSSYYSDSEHSSAGCTDISNSISHSEGHSSPEPIADYSVDEDWSEKCGKEVVDLSAVGSVSKFIHQQIETGKETSSFLVTNLAPVVGQFHQWQRELPMVEPFYAVKCNPDPAILRTLASLGCSFDCATMGEIDLVLNGLGEELSFSRLGRASSSIVYANPAKMPHMLDFAIKNGVRMTVFDGEDELYKIASLAGHEQLQLLLRLTTDDKASICRFSKKFGCPVAEAPHLLDVAKRLGLNIAGVSFHVGSGCGDSDAYVTALDHARRVFEAAEARDMTPMHIIDLGGGFPGELGICGKTDMPTFPDLAAAIRKGITSLVVGLNRPMDSFRFIAEPGRYFVSASTVIATKIYSRKGGANPYQALYVDDGVYGSFNNVVYDHALPIPLRLASVIAAQQSLVPLEPEVLIQSAVFGPTCDGLDQMCSLDDTLLPRCEVGEWLIWENQGAYTHTASFVFNGYTHIPQKSYCYL